MSIYSFQFDVHCADNENPDLAKVEQMIDLSMQDLVYDDEFIAALGEKQAVTIQVRPILVNHPKENG
jgi:hypothetical protein